MGVRDYARRNQARRRCFTARIHHRPNRAQTGEPDNCARGDCRRAAHLPAVATNVNRHTQREPSSGEQLHKTLELDPSFAITNAFLGDAFVAKGDLPCAIEEYETAARLDPYFGTVELGYVYAVAGRAQDARKILDQMTQFSKEHYVSAYASALLYAGFGDKDKAISSLEKSYRDGESEMGRLARARKLDSLHGDSRFQALVQEIQVRGGEPAHL